jgi:NADH-quinone oxidoreductase subunit L
VIHGTHEEQDITRMGGLRRAMPVTFVTYSIGMMALAGVPFLFAGFWSKDEILHAASGWQNSKLPFVLGLFGAFLTAFYMTRQMFFVFFGEARHEKKAHESPRVMTVPLIILAGCSMLIGFLATPAWPWLHHYLTGEELHGGASALVKSEFLVLAFFSTIIVSSGMAAAWYLYRKYAVQDPLEARVPGLFLNLRARLWVDEIYDATVLRFTRFGAGAIGRVETAFSAALSNAAAFVTLGLGWFSRLFDNLFIDGGFDRSCRGLSESATAGSKLQNGQVQGYLRTIAITLAVLVLILIWGCKGV